ncbi:helix-turn-helix domain-containing protein [Parabacteroides goldsteinii]|uniref:helix-turn-helix domain-containing protein n=2 Tax=Parabacteroides goldsteinii TaxID=328812 RepID=UPI0009E23C00|nr:AraC family transcriptional regulator [Parabacteroides goldsteinii]
MPICVVYHIALLQMNASLQLLINDKYTIKEIAYELGFTDDAYFCRVFKKHYGIIPGDYKKRRGEVLF